MHSPEPGSTSLESHLEQALETADDPTTKYHLREALQKLSLDRQAETSDRIRHAER